MSETLARIVEEVKALDEAERHQLQSILRRMNVQASCTPENALEQQLAAEGMLSLPIPDFSSSQLPAPFVVQGRPLSEVLVEGRR